MRLKKYIILSSALMAFSLSSCSDYLDVKPTNAQTTESFYQTEGQVDQALTGIYHDLLPMSLHYWYMSECRSDNTWAVSDAKRDIYDIAHFHTDTDLSEYNTCWGDYYELIAHCNAFLQNVEPFEMDATAKKQYLGEVHFLRALAYFDLVRYFGNIPKVDKVLDQAEALQLKQSDPAIIYNDVIIPDLNFAVENLLDVPINYLGTPTTGHACRVAALALRGKVYATMAGFPLEDISKKNLAVTDLKAVIDYAEKTGKYWANGTGANGWPYIWVSDNDNKYHIFEIQYTNGGLGLGNVMVFNSLRDMNASQYTNVRIFGNTIYCEESLVETFGGIFNSLTGRYEFKGTDLRAEATLIFENIQKNDGTYVNNELPMIQKFFEHRIKRAALGFSDIDATIADYNDWPIDWPIIRLEDVMLLYAELTGPTPEAVTLVNKIRNRVGLGNLKAEDTASANAFDSVVSRERRLELASEGQRWFDEVRRNEWKELSKAKYIRRAVSAEAVENNVKDGMYLYPIPDDQMKVKDGLYVQNEAYR